MSELISVVVPTRNAERTLRACLESLRGQQGVDLEIVVVDNHSSDATPTIAAELADLAVTDGPERIAQRNRGTELSHGSWICWIDADMVLPADALAAAWTLAVADGVRAIGLPEVSTGEGFWTACRALERRCYDQVELSNPRFLRRDLLAELGGFDVTMAGPEDTDLRLALHERGERVGYVRARPIIHDEGRLTLASVWRKRVYYGRSLPAFTARNPGGVQARAGELARAYWRHRRLFVRDLPHAVGLAGLRGLEAVGYLWGAHLGRRREPAVRSVR